MTFRQKIDRKCGSNSAGRAVGLLSTPIQCLMVGRHVMAWRFGGPSPHNMSGVVGKGSRLWESQRYTSMPLTSEVSSVMLKSCSVWRTRISVLTVARSRSRAPSSYILEMTGHSASNGIHWWSR